MSSLIKTDPLLVLYKTCKGAVRVSVNEHTTGYHGAVDEMSDRLRRDHNFKVEKFILQEIADANTMTEVVVHPTPEMEQVSIFGATPALALERAAVFVLEALGQKDYNVTPYSINLTETLDELAKNCNAAVHLDINSYKVPKYWNYFDQDWSAAVTAAVYLAHEEASDPEKFQKGGDFSSPEELEIMKERDEVIGIAFYPNSPVGFCSWYHTEIDEMLTGSIKAAKDYKLGESTSALYGYL